MHNLTKISLFRFLLRLSFIPALVLVYPFVFFRRKKSPRLVFFFDRFAIGGAQRVHLDILESVADQPKQVYFTRRSPDSKLKEAFYAVPNAANRDIHVWCDNLIFRLFSVHYYAFYLNRHERLTILSSNSTFFYDLLPFLKKDHIKIELLHNFSFGKKGMEFFGLANHRFLNKRMVIDANTLDNIRKQYAQYHIAPEFMSRVELVEFGVDVPPSLVKNYDPPLNILYAGRGGPQKRVWLIDRIGAHFFRKNAPVVFHFAGTMEKDLTYEVKMNSVLHGEIGHRDRMHQLYASAQVLLLTSAFEGFPLVVKESMAYGCVPLVTALPGNRIHLTNGENALLIEAIDDEAAVIQEGIAQIEKLLRHPELLQTLSKNAHQYALEHFSRQPFLARYSALLTKNR